MSSRSNYSLYASYSGASSAMTGKLLCILFDIWYIYIIALGPSQSVSRIGHNKEQEVDNLTDMLVQGMGTGPDLDHEEYLFGICVKCGDKVNVAVNIFQQIRNIYIL